MTKSAIILVCVLLCVSFVTADVKLVSSSDKEIKVEVTVPPYEMKTVKAGDVECLVIHIKGASMLMEAGYPMVPKLTQLVKVPHDCKVKLSVLSKEEEQITLKAPILPSKGHLTRDIDPESVPYEFGPIYKQDVFWPAAEDQFQIGSNFELRDACGVRIQILPIRANHVQMKMNVLKKAVLSLTFEHDATARFARSEGRPNKTYKKIYSEMFLNYEESQDALRGGTMPDPNNRKLVVVTPQQYQGTIGTWVEWKRKSGYTVTVNAVADGTTASQIKSYLQGIYDNTNTRFGYVVLIGDAGYTSNFETAKPMPTFKGKKEGAAADRVYVRLAGNDNYPDAFISRISGNNETEIKNQLDKIMAYEQNPPAGKWFVQGICIASNQGSPTDKERAEWLQNGGGAGQKVPVDAGGLVGHGYQKFTDIYDPYAYATDVTKAVNEGVSIICYIGHGSATSWGTTGFSVNDVRNLNNPGMYPVIWSVACVNGQFVHTGECFAEAWLRKANGGSVAMEAASTNESWVPPCDKQVATVNSIIRKQQFTFGAQETIGCIKGLEVWGDTDSSEGNKMAEQCNLFGDCTMLVRSKSPQMIAVNAARGLDNNVEFTIAGQETEPSYVVVSVYNADMSYVVSEETESGRANIILDECPNCQLFYTIVGDDIVPVIDQPLQ